MFRKLIINKTEHETRVALLEDGEIVELFIERNDNSNIVGNIYKGRVQRVLPGMQAAFVDIRQNHAAFICVGDIARNTDNDYEQVFLDSVDEEDSNGNDVAQSDSSPASMPVETNRLSIVDLLTEGQEILVQVSKSPIGTKGPTVTSHISLPGRFLVLMPTSNHIGVSRRIEDEAERNRLKDVVTNSRKGEYGYIIRTAAEEMGEKKLAQEMRFLENLWQNIQNKYKTAPTSSLIHRELTVELRAVRDVFTLEADRLVIDSKSGYNLITAFLNEFNPVLKDSVDLYSGSEPIFDAYNLEGDITRALKKKVWLKSGGYIIIDQTEALVAIDVNTGRYVGKHNLEETILKTNLEAVKEIAFQIRLRDLGGIIIIDFIDMEKKANQEKVFNAVCEGLNRDKCKTHVLPMSELGLIQMTRKRIRRPLGRLLCEPCFYCDGEGTLMARKTICYNIYREVLRLAQDMVGKKLTLQVNPAIADLLHGEENSIIVSLEMIITRQIVIYPNSKFHIEEFDIVELMA